MAELTISADDIQGAIDEYVSSFTSDTAREEVGTVIDTGDGIAHVEGLPSVMTQELLEFPGGVLGVALNLDEHSIGAVILGDFEKIAEGQQVKRTGEVLSVPVGDGFLGRVVDPLAHPIDGRGDIEAAERRALELQAPSVVQRQAAPPASDINYVLALALFVFLCYHLAGVWRSGLIGYPVKIIKGHVWGTLPTVVGVIFSPINVVEELAKPISLSLRLFGNMFAGGILVALIALFPPYIMWAPNAIWKAFDLFVGAIQAFIFALLTVLYFSQSMELEGEHD